MTVSRTIKTMMPLLLTLIGAVFGISALMFLERWSHVAAKIFAGALVGLIVVVGLGRI